ESVPFQISTNLYNKLFRDSFRVLSLVRANISIDDGETGFIHPAGHLEDFNINGRDFSGGWYNAGDYGKWTHCSSVVVANLLWLYILNPFVRTDDLGIPESGNNIPDLLDEARWGLTWLLKMQNADGSVYHKIDTEPGFAWGKGPDEDALERSPKWTDRNGRVPSTIDAADFCGVMSLASDVFLEVDPGFALVCREAALRSWEWVRSHPENPQKDPYYTDDDPSQELFWAGGDIFILTGGEEGIDFIEGYAQPSVNAPSWLMTDYYGILALCIAASVPGEIRNSHKAALLKTSDLLLEKINRYPYGHVLEDFWWGSNSSVAGSAQILIAAYKISGKDEYLSGGLEQLNYLLGCNALNLSFVTGFGKNSVEHPYHWSYYVYDKLIPGWISGGPNRYPGGADPLLKSIQQTGTPPAMCFVDACEAMGSWASNEGTIAMTSSLMFLAGLCSE
ncbi:MAG: glycoside hydrolase family 9 protein, partial [Spirochaetales bacterium]|nr:glycoside hydrolase family 9 protein [Spirochaetales bacterium]